MLTQRKRFSWRAIAEVIYRNILAQSDTAFNVRLLFEDSRNERMVNSRLENV